MKTFGFSMATDLMGKTFFGESNCDLNYKMKLIRYELVKSSFKSEIRTAKDVSYWEAFSK
jgi:hypothetical protein